MGGGRLLYEYPLHELAVRASKMTLVHSRAAGERLLEGCPESTVRIVRENAVYHCRFSSEDSGGTPKRLDSQRGTAGSTWIRTSLTKRKGDKIRRLGNNARVPERTSERASSVC